MKQTLGSAHLGEKMRRSMFSIFKKSTSTLQGKGFGKVPFVMHIYYFLYRHIGPKGITLVDVCDSKMYIDASDSTFCSLLMRGSWEDYETELFKKAVKQGDVVVDVGSHWGYYTLLAAKLIGKKGKVFAFEPNPSNYALLVRNIEVNGYDNVIPVRKAVSDKCGFTNFFLCEDTAGGTIYNYGNNKKSIAVETVTLDEFFKDKNTPIDIIKIDAEGAERAILLGMDRVIKQNENLKLFIEFWPFEFGGSPLSPREFLNKLTEYGFKIGAIDETKRCVRDRDINVDNLIELYKSKKIMNLLLEK